MATTVHVSNIAHATTQQEVHDFFSFCGKILTLALTPTSADPDSTLSATVTYERSPAAKTALLLDGTKLGPNPVRVEATQSLDELAGQSSGSPPPQGAEHEVRQEDKPKTAILAEYLSHGYAIGDVALQKSIELDSKTGISQRFITTLNSALTAVDAKRHAQQMDAQLHVSDRAVGARNTLTTYFEKALGTPTGQRIRQFYETGGKSLMDIHNEARRLAELRKKANPGAPTGPCPCTAGGDCEKNKCYCHCHGEKAGPAPGSATAPATQTTPSASASAFTSTEKEKPAV